MDVLEERERETVPVPFILGSELWLLKNRCNVEFTVGLSVCQMAEWGGINPPAVRFRLIDVGLFLEMVHFVLFDGRYVFIIYKLLSVYIKTLEVSNLYVYTTC